MACGCERPVVVLLSLTADDANADQEFDWSDEDISGANSGAWNVAGIKKAVWLMGRGRPTYLRGVNHNVNAAVSMTVVDARGERLYGAYQLADDRGTGDAIRTPLPRKWTFKGSAAGTYGLLLELPPKSTCTCKGAPPCAD